MFRIDNDTVCDATMAGGPARYINHSCDPNCVAETVEIDKESKIIIITNRKIVKGEEVSVNFFSPFINLDCLLAEDVIDLSVFKLVSLWNSEFGKSCYSVNNTSKFNLIVF